MSYMDAGSVFSATGVHELSLDEIDAVNGAYSLREHAEAFLVGAGAGAIVSGGNPVGILAGGVIAVGVLYL